MSTVSLTLDEIFDLAKMTLLANGCDDETASILSNLIKNAEIVWYTNKNGEIKKQKMLIKLEIWWFESTKETNFKLRVKTTNRWIFKNVAK